MSECSEPNVVAGLLDQLTSLQDKLDQDQDVDTDKRWERDLVEMEDLDAVRDEVRELATQLQQQQQATLDKFSKKMTEVGKTWTALETQTGWLRLEVNTLNALTTALRRASENPKTSILAEGMPIKVRPDPTIVETPGDHISNTIKASPKERCEVLARRDGPGKAVNVLEDGTKILMHTEEQFLKRFGSLQPMENGRSLGIDPHNVLKQLVEAQESIESAVRQHSMLLQNARKIGSDAHLQTPVADEWPRGPSQSIPDKAENSPGSTKEGPQKSTSLESQLPACVELKIPCEHTNGDIIPISSVTLATSPSKSSMKKRRWVDLSEDYPKTSMAGSQRRRTGLQTYTSISNPSGTSKQDQSYTANGKLLEQRNLSRDRRARSGPNQTPEQQTFYNNFPSPATNGHVGSASPQFISTVSSVSSSAVGESEAELKRGNQGKDQAESTAGFENQGQPNKLRNSMLKIHH